MPDEDKSGLDQALDLFVYAPLGLLFTAKDELPGLIAKGRARLDANFITAKVVGQYAVKQARKDADAALTRIAERVARPEPPPAPVVEAPAPLVEAPAPPSQSSNGGPPVASLAIPGYDSLSAPQVVQRLDGLAPPELDAVAEYEEAHRGRRTILSKVAQLQAERP